MEITLAKLRSLIIDAGIIEAEKFDAAKVEADRKMIDIDEVLVDWGLIQDNQLGQLMAGELGYDFVDLSKEKISETIVKMIPEVMSRQRGVVAYGEDDKFIKVAMANPEDTEAKHFIEKRSGKVVKPYYATKRDIAEALSAYKAGIEDDFKKILAQLKKKDLSRDERDNTTVKIVDMLLQYGYESKASDIHIEPFAQKIGVRFRIDGVMQDVLDIPKDLGELILTRIKVLAKMRTDEHRAAQDGKLRYKADAETIDVRVSILPVTNGENVVMRLLSAKSRQFSLTSLGLADADFMKLKKAITNPHGMILVTGPTGSGKSTTLYAILKILNKRDVNIATIEDPVEYDIEGVAQIQVNPKTNLTFADGLRSIVRQDPDIIMVGEIRDEETASIAINAALTGHLVLSTLHTNDAATTLPRLLDMKVEPFLVASTVNMAIAQRLVRQICERCRVSYQLTKADLALVSSDKKIKEILEKKAKKPLEKIRFYKGAGCKVCSKIGYAGRIGIFEILEMSENIKNLILKNASSDELNQIAIKGGMTTMFEDGVTKVLAGMTTLEEVIRVAKE